MPTAATAPRKTSCARSSRPTKILNRSGSAESGAYNHPGSGYLQRHAERERGDVAAGGITNDPEQSRPEGISELTDRGRQSDQQAERRCVELTLNDHCRKRQQVPGRQAEHGAGDEKMSGV